MGDTTPSHTATFNPNPDLVRFLRYLPETGKFYWRQRTPDMFNESPRDPEWVCNNWNSRYSGKEAFTAVGTHGYYTGAIHRKLYLAHRVAFYLMESRWPERVDHINQIKTDNRWFNLREVDQRGNSLNTPIRSDNKTGCMGVHFRKDTGRYFARVTYEGSIINLGTFDSYEQAVEARKKAEEVYGYHKNHNKILP